VITLTLTSDYFKGFHYNFIQQNKNVALLHHIFTYSALQDYSRVGRIKNKQFWRSLLTKHEF